MGHRVLCASFPRRIFFVALGALVVMAACGRGPQVLRLATTTSAYDTGLLEELLPPFEAGNNLRVQVVAVGSGQALELGRRGDADVLLVHAPAKEEEFMVQGYGDRRELVMSNDFVILGPAADPAGVRGLADAAEALQRIARAGATFVSRGDQSGTHLKERALWSEAGLEPELGEGWYKSAGQGMGATLNMAHELQGYVLTDRATYLTRRGRLGLELLVQEDQRLANPYSVIAVSLGRHPDLADAFINYLLSAEAQGTIAAFGGEEYGEPLFHPRRKG